jgi:oxygen-independent coproporphyrinogen-3 oxidase
MTPFIGIGPSAASYMENRRYQNPADLHAWKECIVSGRLAFDTAAAEGTDDVMEIFCFTSLRTAAGLDTQKFKERFGISLEEAYQKEPPPVDQWIGQGLLRKENTRLILTEKGIDVSNEIMSAFMR